MMTKEQFARGWAILTIQPWGKLYRGQGPEATIQAELYYRHVDKANPVVWQAVCESAAMGERWPSLSDLKSALQVNGGYRQEGQKAIAVLTGLQWESAPWPLKSCFTYQKEHDCTLREAARTVLPVWLKDNPTHEDATAVKLLLRQAQQYFGMARRAGGDVRVPL